ncbi:hypothetical protein PTT_08375 [Pyrenophora teres f. teres 0-1]|uniref:Uncharacterized protein n=1 Tax=Pyrenophora teres f. teres (strain 0-1) TaxID=861557 RepID=E3RJM8_PYRTT|nr:hypothetical protein PTT_08375 [Pyrenophora teres f. teres 0-1]
MAPHEGWTSAGISVRGDDFAFSGVCCETAKGLGGCTHANTSTAVILGRSTDRDVDVLRSEDSF